MEMVATATVQSEVRRLEYLKASTTSRKKNKTTFNISSRCSCYHSLDGPLPAPSDGAGDDLTLSNFRRLHVTVGLPLASTTAQPSIPAPSQGQPMMRRLETLTATPLQSPVRF
ncbi:expressed unknown protein [Seminavis robusta]|uniref:Uncharacterized protein n=1 Tax=Seminavis robusta TaxID=568900 RepID=A0A9N8E0T9_9STRA|nr:expressed unknown protein [Seminavis robusta]|eukprot:Sro423_g139831.1  (113) ;mRNA; r:60065-60403